MLEEVRSATGLLPDPKVPPWNEASVPIERRGVSLAWLTHFVDRVQSVLNLSAEVPAQFSRSKEFAPASETPAADPSTYRFLNTHGLVAEIVKPSPWPGV